MISSFISSKQNTNTLIQFSLIFLSKFKKNYLLINYEIYKHLSVAKDYLSKSITRSSEFSAD